MNIVDFLNDKEFTSKQQIMKETGLDERTVRRKISELKKERVVIYNSKTKGWKLAKYIDPDRMSAEEIQNELEMIEHSLNDIKSRMKVFKKQMRKYIAYKKKVEQVIIEKGA